MEDHRGKTIYICRRCIVSHKSFKTTSLESIKNHVKKCKINNIKSYELNKDYVVCQECNQHGLSISSHITKIHKITLKEYKRKYKSPTICQKSSNNYGDAGKGRKGWLEIARENGVNVSEKLKIIGEKISATIMSNSEERKRRSNLLKELQPLLNTPEAKQKMSDSAKKTSARPDIQQQRSERLANWRKENPEDFKIKCTEKMLAAKPKKITWFSKPEKLLFEYLKSIPGFNFRFNQIIKSYLFNWKSKRKQIDMADKKSNIYVEFDGPTHFKSMGREEALLEVKRRDALLEEHIKNNNLILIRISYDQFKDKRKNGGIFKEDCLIKINKILNDKIPGIYKIGIYYEQHKDY